MVTLDVKNFVMHNMILNYAITEIDKVRNISLLKMKQKIQENSTHF